MTRILVVDPLPMRGGSKVATEAIFTSWKASHAIQVLTACPQAWRKMPVARTRFATQVTQTSGWRYYAEQLKNTAKLLWHARQGRADLWIGASAPHVDFATAVVSRILKRPYLQFVHGPFPDTKITRWVLRNSRHVFALDSATMPNIGVSVTRFINGIDTSQIQHATPDARGILWAASDMPWKRLDLFLSAVDELPGVTKTVAYMPVCGSNIHQLQAQHPSIKFVIDPPDLDRLRSRHSVFVSTSEQEPFGLSILEAMAAGLCPVIPADGAYWDRMLIEGKTCLKYEAGNGYELRQCLMWATQNPADTRAIGRAAKLVASAYDSQVTYQEIHQRLNTPEQIGS